MPSNRRWRRNKSPTSSKRRRKWSEVKAGAAGRREPRNPSATGERLSPAAAPHHHEIRLEIIPRLRTVPVSCWVRAISEEITLSSLNVPGLMSLTRRSRRRSRRTSKKQRVEVGECQNSSFVAFYVHVLWFDQYLILKAPSSFLKLNISPHNKADSYPLFLASMLSQ